MEFFDEAALRLKQELRMSQDQEVAAVLGLTPRAWVGRKKRGSFPETELLALKGRRPDLKLDVGYVLSGERLSGTSTAALQQAAAHFQGQGSEPNSARHAVELAHELARSERSRRPLYRRIEEQLDWFSFEQVETIEKLLAVFTASSPRSVETSRSHTNQTFHGKVNTAIHGDHATISSVKQTKSRTKP